MGRSLSSQGLAVLILCFSGRIASGKSTLASEVASHLGWRHASFGRYVRAIAIERGLPDSRESLQALGESLSRENWDVFCSSVLSQSGWTPGESAAVDGIRHPEALEALRRVVGSAASVMLVFVKTDSDVRRRRMEERHETLSLAAAEKHSTEIQVPALEGQASLVLDGALPIETLVDAVLKFVEST